ncbi:exosome complex exonuclease RRP41 [Senna tora]|uniref:Exosome complex exonuclease RRP41 n=1 Tax=Senna tora TaxID=362788 RepID=A0A834XDM9_9FABA|nr:exosome complex exonuclease RRP41 [Senna tora]
MAFRFRDIFCSRIHLRAGRSTAFYLNSMLYHCLEESRQDVLPLKWYENAFPRILELTQMLKSVDSINGRLVDVTSNATITDNRIENEMGTFKSLVRVFIGSPSVQRKLKHTQTAYQDSISPFSKASEREPILVDSLTKISNYLNVSAQQRKFIRLTVCPQVTQHRIWTGALEEILNGLKLDLDLLATHGLSKSNTVLGQQIVHSCLKFLIETAVSSDPDSTSWMKLSPSKTFNPSDPQKWEDVLEMFNDLIECFRSETRLKLHVSKLEVMKEGLSQIKDVIVDSNIGYKEARHQESLVQKKLTKTLGHPSRCLFTLLLYYLYRRVLDIEVDIRGGVYDNGSENRFCLNMGRILTSDDEKMVGRGVKQLDQALGIFKFVWETAGMKGNLDLQGHIWCVGAKDRMLRYRGNRYFVHGIIL